MGKERRVGPAEPIKPVSSTPCLVAHRLKLTTRPPNDISVDPHQRRTQLRLIELAVVDDPATDARVVHLGQVLQGICRCGDAAPSFEFLGRCALTLSDWRRAGNCARKCVCLSSPT